MTFNEVKNAVKELNVFPSQLYSLDEIKKDREFGSVLTELEIIKNKMVEQEKKWSKEKSDLETQLSSVVKEKDTITAKQRLNDFVSKDDLKLTDNQRKFILDNFNEQTDVSDKGLQDYITKQIDIFQKVASVITPGQTMPIKTGDGKENTDPTKAVNNPLLKEDYNETI